MLQATLIESPPLFSGLNAPFADRLNETLLGAQIRFITVAGVEVEGVFIRLDVSDARTPLPPTFDPGHFVFHKRNGSMQKVAISDLAAFEVLAPPHPRCDICRKREYNGNGLVVALIRGSYRRMHADGC